MLKRTIRLVELGIPSRLMSPFWYDANIIAEGYLLSSGYSAVLNGDQMELGMDLLSLFKIDRLLLCSRLLKSESKEARELFQMDGLHILH